MMTSHDIDVTDETVEDGQETPPSADEDIPIEEPFKRTKDDWERSRVGERRPSPSSPERLTLNYSIQRVFDGAVITPKVHLVPVNQMLASGGAGGGREEGTGR